MIKIKRDRDFAAIFAAFIFFLPVINYYVNYIIQSYVDVSISTAVYITLYFVVLIAYLYTLRRSLLPIGLLAIVLIVYLITAILFPQNIKFMFGDLLDAAYNPLYRIVFLGLPLIFLPFVMKGSETLYRWMNYLSRFTVIVSLYAYYFIVVGEGRSFEYMTFSYQLLLPLCFCFLTGMRKKQIFWIIIAVIGFISVVAMGSRGAMVSVVLFFAIYAIFLSRQKITTVKLLLMIVGFLGILLIIVNLKTVVKELYDLLLAAGFDSRSLNSFLSGTIFEDTSRERLREITLQSIWDSPILGNGIFGDRYIIGNRVGEEMYAHNIILELLCHYGIFMGGALVVIYFFNAVKTLFSKAANEKILLIYVAIFSAVFFKLFATSSYLSEQGFYLLIGIILYIKKGQLKRGRDETVLD